MTDSPVTDSLVTDSPVTDNPVAELSVNVHACGDHSARTDWVAEEVPVALVYNGVSHAVMMATPTDLYDFALGFSLTEGILCSPEELFSLAIRRVANGVEVDMHIDGERFAALRERRRSLTGRTGCGLCGTESLAQAIRPTGRVSPAPPPSDQAVQVALENLHLHQPLQEATGATHGAAWCDRDGRIVRVREDVGRHNALDKLIGASVSAAGGSAFADGFALVSSRASYEMVQKGTSVGMTCLVAVSAPTALAIREARKAGMTLIGFARQGRHVVYG